MSEETGVGHSAETPISRGEIFTSYGNSPFVVLCEQRDSALGVDSTKSTANLGKALAEVLQGTVGIMPAGSNKKEREVLRRDFRNALDATLDPLAKEHKDVLCISLRSFAKFPEEDDPKVIQIDEERARYLAHFMVTELHRLKASPRNRGPGAADVEVGRLCARDRKLPYIQMNIRTDSLAEEQIERLADELEHVIVRGYEYRNKPFFVRTLRLRRHTKRSSGKFLSQVSTDLSAKIALALVSIVFASAIGTLAVGRADTVNLIKEIVSLVFWHTERAPNPSQSHGSAGSSPQKESNNLTVPSAVRNPNGPSAQQAPKTQTQTTSLKNNPTSAAVVQSPSPPPPVQYRLAPRIGSTGRSELNSAALMKAVQGTDGFARYQVLASAITTLGPKAQIDPATVLAIANPLDGAIRVEAVQELLLPRVHDQFTPQQAVSLLAGLSQTDWTDLLGSLKECISRPIDSIEITNLLYGVEDVQKSQFEEQLEDNASTNCNMIPHN
jgi:hypothetical protein